MTTGLLARHCEHPPAPQTRTVVEGEQVKEKGPFIGNAANAGTLTDDVADPGAPKKSRPEKQNDAQPLEMPTLDPPPPPSKVQHKAGAPFIPFDSI